MFPMSTTEAGICQAMPDTCNTPAPPGPDVPTPYPNVAMCSDATPNTCAQKVTVGGKAALTKKSEIPMSTGDEAGVTGGVVSAKIKGEASYRSFSAKVKVEGNAVVFLTCNVAQNGKNPNAPMGLQAVPSQAKVTVSG